MSVQPLARTLDQELAALARGASLECLVCGEFVMHRGGEIWCPECSSGLVENVDEAAAARRSAEQLRLSG